MSVYSRRGCEISICTAQNCYYPKFDAIMANRWRVAAQGAVFLACRCSNYSAPPQSTPATMSLIRSALTFRICHLRMLHSIPEAYAFPGLTARQVREAAQGPLAVVPRNWDSMSACCLPLGCALTGDGIVIATGSNHHLRLAHGDAYLYCGRLTETAWSFLSSQSV